MDLLTTPKPRAGVAYLRADNRLGVKTPAWNDLSALSLWTYAMADRKGGSSELLAQIRDSSVRAAENLVQNSRQNGYGNTPSLSDYVWVRTEWRAITPCN